MKKLGHMRELNSYPWRPRANLAVYPLRNEAFREESFSSLMYTRCYIYTREPTTYNTCMLVSKQTGKITPDSLCDMRPFRIITDNYTDNQAIPHLLRLYLVSLMRVPH